MRSLLCALLMTLLPGCLVTIDDGYLPDLGRDDGGSDGGETDGGPRLDAYYPFQHAPEDCPDEAARAREVCDPSCDGVSHFYCTEEPGDPCCACLRLAGGGDGGGGGDNPPGSGEGGGDVPPGGGRDGSGGDRPGGTPPRPPSPR